MKELSLYNITNAFPTLLQNAEMSEEEKQIVEKELTALLQQKSQNIIGYTKNIELTIEAMKSEEKRISEQRKALENRLTTFRDYVKECMENNGIFKVETGLGTLSVRKNPLSVDIVDESKISDEYKTRVETIKVDKAAIKEDFKQTGELIEGVKYNFDNTSLVIK